LIWNDEKLAKFVGPVTCSVERVERLFGAESLGNGEHLGDGDASFVGDAPPFS
jgi:hypothetical protein